MIQICNIETGKQHIMTDEQHEEACSLGLGVPSVNWEDEAIELWISNPEQFKKEYITCS